MRCEDYPCCGHTDGLPCDWTYTPEARAFDMAHLGCEHEAGYCEAYDSDSDDDICYDCGEEYDYCVCGEDYDEPEDRHLDGSYEE